MARGLTVAIGGLGAIGAPMARHLARPEFDLVVWNRTTSRASEFVAATEHARAVDTPARAAEGRDIVMTCLPVSGDVESLLDGPAGEPVERRAFRGTALPACGPQRGHHVPHPGDRAEVAGPGAVGRQLAGVVAGREGHLDHQRPTGQDRDGGGVLADP